MRPTGVALLDGILGGLAPGFPLVISGPTGSGRTVLCLQLAAAAVDRGECVAMLTGEPAGLLLRQASALDLDLTPALRNASLALLELDPHVASTARVHGGGALVDAIAQAAPEAQLLLVDPLNSLTSEVLDEVALRALVRALFDRAAAGQQCVVVTLEQELAQRDPTLERVLKQACGALLEIERHEDGIHLLHVIKSRVAGCESGPVRFRIESRGACPCPPAGGDGPGLEHTSPLEAVQRAQIRWQDLDGTGSSSQAPQAPSQESTRGSRNETSSSPDPHSQDGSDSRATLATTDATGDAATRPRILIVDDCAFDREQMKDWLEDRYDIAVAADGFEALSALLAHRPELVVLDLLMPRVDGFEVLRALRAAGSRAPVLVVSGSLARAVDRVRVLVLGASDTLAKPVQRFELRRKVEALLRTPAPPLDSGVEDVEALLGGATSTRVLDEGPFRERLERACRFGEEFGLASALVAIEAPSQTALRAMLAAAEKALRAEDAVLELSERRLLLLLVATEIDFIPRILGRFQTAEKPARRPRGCRWFAELAEPIETDKPWDRLFEQLQPWPRSGHPS